MQYVYGAGTTFRRWIVGNWLMCLLETHVSIIVHFTHWHGDVLKGVIPKSVQISLPRILWALTTLQDSHRMVAWLTWTLHTCLYLLIILHTYVITPLKCSHLHVNNSDAIVKSCLKYHSHRKIIVIYTIATVKPSSCIYLYHSENKRDFKA